MRNFILMAIFLGLAACATVDGLGQDISTGARSIERMF